MNRRRGSVLIEAALVLSVLLAMLVGMTGLTVRMMTYHFVTAAAREGARFAEVHGAASATPASEANVEQYVRRFAVAVAPSDVRVKTIWSPDNQPGSRVRVEVQAAGLSAASEVTVLH